MKGQNGGTGIAEASSLYRRTKNQEETILKTHAEGKKEKKNRLLKKS